MRKIQFNEGWMYSHKGDGSKRRVTLPHDAMIHEPRDASSAGGSALGYFPGGIYVYEKDFSIPADWESKQVYLEFEGVYKNATVWINGMEAGGAANGYVPFWIDVSAFLNPGAENTIRLEADNSLLPNSRWYTGGGIYRPVWLHVGEKKHIKPEGIKINTISITPARIEVKTDHVGGHVSVSIVDPLGKTVATGEGDDIVIDIPDAKLWSDDSPNLYTCQVSLRENDATVDQAVELFGIRTIEWSEKGLFINGRETLLRGGCIHHDNGILGGATFAESEERRVRIMKKAGFNALRSSHNLTSKAMLNACDRLGMYMMDETWDMWYFHKNKYDYATDFMAWYKHDLEAMVKRDYNHPSVIMYSIGNEVSEPKDEKGVELAREMVGLVHAMDSSRPVTAGINLWVIDKASKGEGVYNEEGGRNEDEDQGKKKMQMTSSTLFNSITAQIGTGMNNASNSPQVDALTSPCLDALDIAGYNYTSGRYPLEGEAHPKRVIVGAETFPQDIYKNWTMVERLPYLIGDFMWTAWDYLGEAGLGAWAYTEDALAFDKPYPWILSETGAIDILGNVGAEAEYAAVVWGTRIAPYIGVQPANHPGVTPAKAVWRGTNAIPSWSWKACEGNETTVEVYAQGSSVALFCNDKEIGRKEIEACKAEFAVTYTPGRLTAVIFDSEGHEAGRADLSSATGSLRIRLQPEHSSAAIGDIVYIPVDLVGDNGVVESNDDHPLSVAVEGGELLAFGSANPRTKERYDAGSFTTYYGRALAIVRATEKGALTVRVSGEGLPAMETLISVQ